MRSSKSASSSSGINLRSAASCSRSARDKGRRSLVFIRGFGCGGFATTTTGSGAFSTGFSVCFARASAINWSTCCWVKVLVTTVGSFLLPATNTPTSTQKATTAKPVAAFSHSGERSKNCRNAASADFLAGDGTEGVETNPDKASSRHAVIDSRTTPNEASSARQFPQARKCSSNAPVSLSFISA